jgi:hypothetical protein
MKMSRLALGTLGMLALVFMLGCSGERRRVSMETNSLTAAYEAKMDNGKTTPEQDKRFIKSISKVAYELDRNIRGKKRADETRNQARKLAGIEEALDLDN